MIIQKIEIEQFGGLKHYELNLEAGVQYLYGVNEAGKSTLCAFIALMFYGMPPKKRGADLRNDPRSLYMPWDENFMAGTLHFHAEGKDYVLSRRFGKTSKTDKCHLYLAADWQEVDMDEGEIGPRFLGVGVDAFHKTLYISQLGAAFSKGKEDELMDRLSNLEQSGDEDASLQKAIAELERAEAELRTPIRHSGKIAKLEEKINALGNELFEAKERNRNFHQLLSEIQNLSAAQEALTAELSALEQQRKLAASFEEAEKKRLAQQHILEQKNRLKEAKTALEALTQEILDLTSQKEKMAAVLTLESDVVPKIAEQEARVKILKEQVEQREALTKELGGLEAELNGAKADTKSKVPTYVLALILFLAAA